MSTCRSVPHPTKSPLLVLLFLPYCPRVSPFVACGWRVACWASQCHPLLGESVIRVAASHRCLNGTPTEPLVAGLTSRHPALSFPLILPMPLASPNPVLPCQSPPVSCPSLYLPLCFYPVLPSVCLCVCPPCCFLPVSLCFSVFLCPLCFFLFLSLLHFLCLYYICLLSFCLSLLLFVFLSQSFSMSLCMLYVHFSLYILASTVTLSFP